MFEDSVITHGGITLDLSQVKAFHIDTYSPNKRSHILKIDLKATYQFIKNPSTGEFEKVLIEDYIEHPYADYGTAEAYRDEWQEIWQDYLNEEKL